MVRTEALALEGTPRFWDELAGDLDAARSAVWGPEPGCDWQAGTDATADYLLRWLPRYPDPAWILDLGCGIGRLTLPIAEHFAPAGAWLVGMDSSERMLQLAAGEAERRGVGNVWWSDDGDVRRYGAAFCVQVLQHQTRESAAALIARIADALMPGGRFVAQVVSDISFEDEGRVPAPVARGWFEAAGLTIVAEEQGAIHPEWLWLIGDKP
jgi:SAM-dependent methyltransferase